MRSDLMSTKILVKNLLIQINVDCMREGTWCEDEQLILKTTIEFMNMEISIIPSQDEGVQISKIS